MTTETKDYITDETEDSDYENFTPAQFEGLQVSVNNRLLELAASIQENDFDVKFDKDDVRTLIWASQLIRHWLAHPSAAPALHTDLSYSTTAGESLIADVDAIAMLFEEYEGMHQNLLQRLHRNDDNGADAQRGAMKEQIAAIVKAARQPIWQPLSQKHEQAIQAAFPGPVVEEEMPDDWPRRVAVYALTLDGYDSLSGHDKATCIAAAEWAWQRVQEAVLKEREEIHHQLAMLARTKYPEPAWTSNDHGWNAALGAVGVWLERRNAAPPGRQE